LRRFNSDAECEAALESYRQKPPGGLPAMLGSRRDAASAMRAAKCISINEPRLKWILRNGASRNAKDVCDEGRGVGPSVQDRHGVRILSHDALVDA
jgi:hypothetical protein